MCDVCSTVHVLTTTVRTQCSVGSVDFSFHGPSYDVKNKKIMASTKPSLSGRRVRIHQATHTHTAAGCCLDDDECSLLQIPVRQWVAAECGTATGAGADGGTAVVVVVCRY